MSNVLFNGVFFESSLEAVGDHLLTFVARSRDAARLRASGGEADYADETLDLTIRPLLDEGEYAMGGEFLGSLAAAEAWLDDFMAHLRRRGAAFVFDLFEQDSDGAVLGEMKSFREVPGDRATDARGG